MEKVGFCVEIAYVTCLYYFGNPWTAFTDHGTEPDLSCSSVFIAHQHIDAQY